MSPDTPPDAPDDAGVDASGDGWRDDAEGTRDSFVWATGPDHTPSERLDDTDHVRVETGPEDDGLDYDDHDDGGEDDGLDYDDHDHGGEDDDGNRLAAPAGSAATLDPTRYLLAGETLVERVDTENGWVVVTTHRLLVYDPTADGKRFESVDRPNVLGVDATAGGNPKLLSYIARAAMYAVVLLGGGLVGRSLGLGGLFSTTVNAGSTPAVDGLVSMLSLVGALVGLVVDAFVWGGMVLGVVAFGLSVWYLRDRHPTLAVERAGDDDITVRLPSAVDGGRVVDGLERALAAELADASS